MISSRDIESAAQFANHHLWYYFNIGIERFENETSCCLQTKLFILLLRIVNISLQICWKWWESHFIEWVRVWQVSVGSRLRQSQNPKSALANLVNPPRLCTTLDINININININDNININLVNPPRSPLYKYNVGLEVSSTCCETTIRRIGLCSRLSCCQSPKFFSLQPYQRRFCCCACQPQRRIKTDLDAGHNHGKSDGGGDS